MHRIAIAASLAIALAGCTDDPHYVQPAQALEVNAPGTTGTETVMGQVDLPLRHETDEEEAERQALEAELGGVSVPFATIDDLSISVEWTIKSLSDTDGIATIVVNVGNADWFYLPSQFQIVNADGEVEEEAPPPLIGGIPLTIRAGQVLSGTFREDQLREAAIDLELMTRAMYNPIAAALEVNEETTELVESASGVTVPVSVFASVLRINLEVTADQHMVVEYTVRVRDHRNPDILHDMLLDAPTGELTPIAPADFVPAGLAPAAP